MTYEEYRKRNPVVRQKKQDREMPFVSRPSKMSKEQALQRKKAIFSRELPTRDRVQKLIAASGLCSRRAAEELIAQGRVAVNGVIIKLGDQAGPKDKVTVNGAPIPSVQKLYFVLNKPKGFVTTLKDIYGNRTIMDLIDVEERVYPVGRLDKDTTGVLLVTNDGDFANKIMHPSYEVQKTYIATLDKPFDRKLVEIYARGVRIKEGIVRATVRVIGKTKVSVTLHQGYNHVVKRILKLHGYWVRDLTRISVGPVRLDIPEGAYRFLREEEKKELLSGAKKSRRYSRK